MSPGAAELQLSREGLTLPHCAAWTAADDRQPNTGPVLGRVARTWRGSPGRPAMPFDYTTQPEFAGPMTEPRASGSGPALDIQALAQHSIRLPQLDPGALA